MRCSVIVVNFGGFLEFVVYSVIGFLCEFDLVCFSEVIERFIREFFLKVIMGLVGRVRVKEKFFFEAFTE